MLNIEKTVEAGRARFVLEGRLDTLSSQALERELEPLLSELNELEFDLGKLEYVTSAGLRVLLSAAQAMQERGEMKVTRVSADVMDIFTVTGFDEILKIGS